MCEVRSRKKSQEQTKKKKKKLSSVVSIKKKWTVMNPIWRQMKTQPIQWTEWQTGVLVAAGLL
jgi:hypothetical protein